MRPTEIAALMEILRRETGINVKLNSSKDHVFASISAEQLLDLVSRITGDDPESLRALIALT